MTGRNRLSKGGNHRKWVGVLGGLGLVLMGACNNIVALQPTPTTEAPPPLNPETIRQGRQVYVTNCAVCHGPNAEGAKDWQQPDERGNMPPPPHDDGGHTWRHPDGQLREIILDGWRDPFNKTPDLTMPAFSGKLSDEEIDAVIAYFKSLWDPEHRRYQAEETQKDQARRISAARLSTSLPTGQAGSR